MNQTRLWLAAGIIAVVVFVGFAFSVPHTKPDLVYKQDTPPAPAVPTVAVRDTYKKGVHTITGSLTVPNACARVTASATALGSASSTTGIALALTLSSDSGVCLQLPADVSFSTTIAAPAALPIAITVNGAVASTTSL